MTRSETFRACALPDREFEEVRGHAVADHFAAVRCGRRWRLLHTPSRLYATAGSLPKMADCRRIAEQLHELPIEWGKADPLGAAADPQSVQAAGRIARGGDR